MCSLGACSFLFDTTRMQCKTDSDCRAVGLIDGACIERVCQPMTSVATDSATPSTSVPTRNSSEEERPAAEGSGGMRSASSGSDAVRRGTELAGKPAVEDGGTSSVPASAGASGTAASSGSPSGASPTCARPKCECNVDADCLARGVANGTCVENRCWEPEVQCQVDSDCTTRGPEYAGGRCQDKQCLPNPLWRCDPPPPASPSDMLEISLPVIDALQLRRLPNVPVVACNKLDSTCMTPMAMATTDMDGIAKLNVPGNFSGYMQSTERTDYVQSMYFMPIPLPEKNELSNWPLIGSAALSGLGVLLNTRLDPERGHAMLIVEDCKGTALPSIAFSTPQADMGTTAFYVRDQIPTTAASDTPPEGDGGYANLPPGVVEITATDVNTKLVINKVTLLIRAGAITTAYIRPSVRGTTVTGRFPLGP